MPSLAFAMTATNHESRRFEFRGKNKADYYDGELRPILSHAVNMQIEKSIAGKYAIYKLTSRSGLLFRRSWQHIREDKTDVTVIWFVRHGTITISYPGIKHKVSAQECAVTRSSRPFNMELLPDNSGILEAMHIVVPSHELHAIISDRLEVGRPFPTSSGNFALAERIVEILFDEDDEIDFDIAEQLVGTLLDGLGKSIAKVGGNRPPPSSIAEQRVADIMACVNRHIANPDLNARMVASQCDISLRYLCHVLKKCNLQFSDLVWEKRMQMAALLLKNPAMRTHHVSEIGYLVGFKSSAHFSRKFKTTFGIAPRAYRDLDITNRN